LRTAGERHTSHQPAPHTTTTTTLPQYFFKGFDAAGEGEEGEWDDGSEYDEEDNEEAIIFGYLDEGDLMERFKQAKGGKRRRERGLGICVCRRFGLLTNCPFPPYLHSLDLQRRRTRTRTTSS